MSSQSLVVDEAKIAMPPGLSLDEPNIAKTPGISLDEHKVVKPLGLVVRCSFGAKGQTLKWKIASWDGKSKKTGKEVRYFNLYMYGREDKSQAYINPETVEKLKDYLFDVIDTGMANDWEYQATNNTKISLGFNKNPTQLEMTWHSKSQYGAPLNFQLIGDMEVRKFYQYLCAVDFLIRNRKEWYDGFMVTDEKKRGFILAPYIASSIMISQFNGESFMFDSLDQEMAKFKEVLETVFNPDFVAILKLLGVEEPKKIEVEELAELQPYIERLLRAKYIGSLEQPLEQIEPLRAMALCQP